jgi:hypothetical protein
MDCTQASELVCRGRQMCGSSGHDGRCEDIVNSGAVTSRGNFPRLQNPWNVAALGCQSHVHATFMQPLVVFTVPLQRRMLPLGIHDPHPALSFAGQDKGVRNFCPLGKHHWSANRNSSMMTRFKIVSPMERRVYRRQQTQLLLRSFEAARPRRKFGLCRQARTSFYVNIATGRAGSQHPIPSAIPWLAPPPLVSY